VDTTIEGMGGKQPSQSPFHSSKAQSAKYSDRDEFKLFFSFSLFFTIPAVLGSFLRTYYKLQFTKIVAIIACCCCWKNP